MIAYAALWHSRTISDVTNLQSTLDNKTASSHTHAISDVTNFQTNLDGKADSSHTHAISSLANYKYELLNLIYLVGSIYLSINETSPATLFGGTWERSDSQFLYCNTNSDLFGQSFFIYTNSASTTLYTCSCVCAWQRTA